MILIITRAFEPTTIDVINWLKQKNADFLVLDSKSEVNLSLNINHTDIDISINDLSIKEFNSLWYRNGELKYSIQIEGDNEKINRPVTNFLNNEWKVVIEYFLKNFKTKKSLGDHWLRDFNKLDQLILAKKCGLNIPVTIIGTKRSDFDNLNNKAKITKPIQDIFTTVIENVQYSSYVKEISDNDIQCKEKTFFPSLVQEKIERKYELRIFFIETHLYPMAVFNNLTDTVDIRENNFEGKRYVPFILDALIKEKIIDFIDQSGLSTGSIDMIVSKKNKFIFLEVNPFGQFDFLNRFCNYYIEKDIANYLF